MQKGWRWGTWSSGPLAKTTSPAVAQCLIPPKDSSPQILHTFSQNMCLNLFFSIAFSQPHLNYYSHFYLFTTFLYFSAVQFDLSYNLPVYRKQEKLCRMKTTNYSMKRGKTIILEVRMIELRISSKAPIFFQIIVP